VKLSRAAVETTQRSKPLFFETLESPYRRVADLFKERDACR
jgi:hypothetical protein